MFQHGKCPPQETKHPGHKTSERFNKTDYVVSRGDIATWGMSSPKDRTQNNLMLEQKDSLISRGTQTWEMSSPKDRTPRTQNNSMFEQNRFFMGNVLTRKRLDTTDTKQFNVSREKSLCRKRNSPYRQRNINIIHVISKTGGSGTGTVVIFFVYPFFFVRWCCFLLFSLSECFIRGEGAAFVVLCFFLLKGFTIRPHPSFSFGGGACFLESFDWFKIKYLCALAIFMK